MVKNIRRKLKDMCLDYLVADEGYKYWYLIEILNVLEPNMKGLRDSWYYEKCAGGKI